MAGAGAGAADVRASLGAAEPLRVREGVGEELDVAPADADGEADALGDASADAEADGEEEVRAPADCPAVAA